MESPLEVLSRAATMVQDNSHETRLTSKELPTTKWRRERRIRVSSEYHSPPSPVIKPLSESNSSNSGEIPLDMSVATKPRTPPPPYREPLPGSTFATALARPSVITQAPKREIISNRENKDTKVTESISMIDPVIDEHFRRSLGAEYANIFGNKNNTNHNNIITTTTTSTNSNNGNTTNSDSNSSTPTSVSTSTPTTTTTSGKTKTIPKKVTTITTAFDPDSTEMSVDDHFAKALGNDTWKQLQADNNRNDNGISNSSTCRATSQV